METETGGKVYASNKQAPSFPPRPPLLQPSRIRASGAYKTTQLRRDRFKKFGNCKSAPISAKAPSTTSDIKSHSSTNLTVDNQTLSTSDPVQEYIEHSRESLGLETAPLQHSTDTCTPAGLRESLLVSSGPITGVRDLKALSRRLSEISSPTKSSSSSVEFMYALSKENKKGCPVYDLYFTSADKARAQGRYYTISALNVSEVYREIGMDSVSSLRWLWEKEIFYRITALPYFKQFMIRKAFKVWHHWICQNKTSKQKVKLRYNLFSADTVLQKAILEVQSICEAASSSSFSHYFENEIAKTAREIKLISLSESTYTLRQFTLLQTQTVTEAREQLYVFREAIVAVIVSVCQNVVDREEISELSSLSTKEIPPSHVNVLEWRKTLERLNRLTCLCGGLVVQLLQRLVLKAVNTLLFITRRLIRKALARSADQDESFSLMRETVTSNPFTQGILDRQDISLDDEAHAGLVSMQASSFSTLLPSLEAGVGSLSEFAEVMIPAEENKDTTNPDIADISYLLRKPEQVIPPLWEVQLTLDPEEQVTSTEVTFTPTLDEFDTALANMLSSFEKLIKDFKSLLCDERIQPFVGSSKYDLLKTLEVAEAKKSATKTLGWIDCENLLQNYAPYQNVVDQLNKCLTLTMTEVDRKLAHYKCYNKMLSVCSEAEITSSSCENWSVPMFQRNFALYHDQVHAMEGMVLSFQVGIVEVKAVDYQMMCLTQPQRIIAVLEEKLPQLASAKCDHLSTEIKDYTHKLLDIPSDVVAFVCYVENVENVISAVPLIEKRMIVATNMYNVAQQFEVKVADEEMALYKSLFPQFRHLKNVLMQAQATKSETVYQFSSDLKKMVVEVLKAANELKAAIESSALAENCDQPLDVLGRYELTLNTLLSQARDYVDYHHTFGSIPSSKRRFHAVDSSVPSWTPEEVLEEVSNVAQSLKARQSLFRVIADWDNKMKQWRTAAIVSLGVAEIQRDVKGFINQVNYLEKELSPSNKMISQLHSKVIEFRSWLPTLSCLLNPALKLRHWELIHRATGEVSSLSKGHTLTIDYLQKVKVFDHHAIIVSVSNEANHEAALESMLKKVSSEWMNRELVLVGHSGLTERPTHILSGVEDLLASIEDSLLTINTIKSSKYVKPIKHSVLDWQSRLVLMLETVECWIHCQKNWLYLESIFTTVDIQRQLSWEAKLFLQADKSLREVVRIIAEKPTALKATTTPGALELLQSCNVLLEQVFKSLEDFLEAKRIGFPRLYFISNEELLDILAHTKQPLTVQAYLGKLFANVKLLDAEVVSPVAANVLALVSSEGEKIKLCKSVNARGAPEKWLSSLNNTSCETVRKCLKEGAVCYNQASRVSWAINQPTQIALTVALVKWTEEVERCFETVSPTESLLTLFQSWNYYIADLAKLCQTDEPSVLKRGLLVSLLIQDVHCRDVIHHLIKDNITSSDSFQWIRHLRHYWDEENQACQLKQLCAVFPYGNEFLGCPSRLVVTPLTERCYLTLTTALHLHLGASLLGPAGTGKSESVKDLAKIMGRFCLLINCSESLEYKAMGQIFSGLCQSGSWCCFDEFNRIKADVLAVLAQQLKCIKEAKERRIGRFVFEGREIKMDASCGIFITTNPRYIGRVELPNNVNVFFRPIAMMKPDTTTISEVLLLSNGFVNAPSLATKLTKFFEFMETQVSKQVHYDFGLRAIKAVISVGRANLLQIKKSKGDSDKQEVLSLVSAIKDVNLSKLLSKDTTVMFTLLQQFFGTELVNKVDELQRNSLLQEYIQRAAVECSLQTSDVQTLQCVQLYKTIGVRHGVVVMGTTGSGKSTVIQLLRGALNLAGRMIHSDHLNSQSISSKKEARGESTVCELEMINPKSVSFQELYGYVDKNTLEWKNGLLPKILKKLCNELTAKQSGNERIPVQSSSLLSSSDSQEENSETTESNDKRERDNNFAVCYPPSAPAGWRWIVLDGPIDPMWIENLNTALDDSKLLCLSNNERISLQPGLRLLFETDSLENASPATVSRCGIVLMDTQLLCWKQYTASWINQLPAEFPEEGKSLLRALFDQSIYDGNKFLTINRSQLSCKLPIMGAIRTLCIILRSLIDFSLKEFPGLYQNFSTKIGSNCLKSQDSSSSVGVQALAGIYIPKKAAKQEISDGEHIEQQSELFQLIGKLYVFSFTWAYGGCFESALEEDDAMEGLGDIKVTRGGNTVLSQFDALVHKMFSSSDSVVHVKLPTTTDLIFSYYIDIHSSSFLQWKTLVPSPKQIATKMSLLRKGLGNISSKFSSPFFKEFSTEDLNATSVPLILTVSTVQLTYLASLLGNNVMLVGKTSVGKTQFLKYLSDILLFPDMQSAVVYSVQRANRNASKPSNFDLSVPDNTKNEVSGFEYQLSTRTTSLELQSAIGSYCIRTGKSVLKPAMGEKVIAFLDDLHMPGSDMFGTQQCSEFLRQLLNNGGWYDRRNLTWKDVSGVQVVATSGRKGWGHAVVSERCLSKFSVFCLPEPSLDSLQAVYTSHLSTAFSDNFTDDLLRNIPNIVSCVLFMFQKVASLLKPSPHKPLCTFSIRDLSKVFLRLLHASHRSVKEAQDIIQLLSHEFQRVFKDRCFPEDRDHIYSILSEGLRIHFKMVVPVVNLKEQLLLYEDFTNSFGRYLPVKSPNKLMKNLERIQSQYNLTEDKSFQLSFFPQVCGHIIRVTRVLQQLRGNMILVGEGGIGRRSCAQLACHIANCSYHCLTVCEKSPGEALEEVKSVVIQCGVTEKVTCLLATESLGSEQDDVLHILHELMRGGNVRCLFSIEEVESILSQLSEVLTVKERSECLLSSRELWRLFVKRVLGHLHIVLCVTPSSPVLAVIYKSYQSVLTHSTIDVFDEWDPKALFGLAGREILECDAANSDLKLKELSNQLATTAVKMHEMVLSAQSKSRDHSPLSFTVTPTTFIQFVQKLCAHLSTKNSNIRVQRSHLEEGLSQLRKTNRDVDIMRGELNELHPGVTLKTKEVEILLCQLTVEQQQLDTLRATVAEERAAIALETEQVLILKEEAEEDLQAVLPDLDRAEHGLRNLDKKHFDEIRSYGRPPAMVVHVMNAVCLLLGQPTDWKTAKQLTRDGTAFLKLLYSYDKENVPDKVLAKLRKFTRDEGFTPKNVALHSVACQSFCEWVLAVERYAEVFRVVQPKRSVYQDVRDKLELVMEKLSKKERHLNELEQRLSELEDKYRVKMEERGELQSKCDEISLKLNRAETITQSLTDEQDRWTVTLSFLDRQESTQIGDSLLSAACLTYLGPFTVVLRQALINEWKQLCSENKLPASKHFKLKDNIGEVEEIQQWHVHGLPEDPHSVENALITTQSTSTPFIIDPQGQASRWLKSFYSTDGLRVLQFDSEDLVKNIKESITEGTTVIIEQVSSFGWLKMEPFLGGQNRQTHLGVEKMDIPYNPSFRMFLVCQDARADLTSDICNKTIVINFSCTTESLQEQLLATAIRLLQPALDVSHSELILRIVSSRKELKYLEGELLNILRSSKGILDDEEVQATLHQLKEVAIDVQTQLEDAQATGKEINLSRQQYIPIAVRGSLLYTEIQGLHIYSPMYRFSMDWFQQIFCECLTGIELTEQEDDLEAHLSAINEMLIDVVLRRASFAVSAKHYTPFVFKLCCSLCTKGSISEPKLSPEEWRVMMKVCSLFKDTNDDTSELSQESNRLSGSSNSQPNSFTPKIWDVLQFFEKRLSCFTGLQNHISSHLELWQNFQANSNPIVSLQNMTEQNGFAPSKLTAFQQLLLVQALCVDKFSQEVNQFIVSVLGDQYHERPLISFPEVLSTTKNGTPILLLHSGDMDAYNLLRSLAKTEQIPGIVTGYIGDSQQKRVSDLLHTAIERGNWILIENCDLGSFWLEKLLKESLNRTSLHQNFRIFLSCSANCVLHDSLIESCVKINLDAPRSIRSNMLHLFSSDSWLKGVFEGGSHSPPHWKQLVYDLCMFHSAINTKRVFGSVVGETTYSCFQATDLQMSISLLTEVFDGGLNEWEVIEHLVGMICYGGRITNKHEKRCNDNLLHLYLSSNCQGAGIILDNPEIAPLVSYKEAVLRASELTLQDKPEQVGITVETFLSYKQTESRQLQQFICQLDDDQKITFQEDLALEKAMYILDNLPSLELSGHTHARCCPDTMIFVDMINREVSEWEGRLSAIRNILQDIVDTIHGGGILSDSQDSICCCLVGNSTPECWSFGGTPKIFLSQWLSFLLDNISYISKLFSQIMNSTKEDKPLPTKLFIQAFASPNGLFTFLKQYLSNKEGIPLEKVDLKASLSSNSSSHTITLVGLAMVGGTFQENCELTTTTETDVVLGVELACRPINMENSTGQGLYYCPVYSSKAKSDQVSSIWIPVDTSLLDRDVRTISLVINSHYNRF